MVRVTARRRVRNEESYLHPAEVSRKRPSPNPEQQPPSTLHLPHLLICFDFRNRYEQDCNQFAETAELERRTRQSRAVDRLILCPRVVGKYLRREIDREFAVSDPVLR